MTSPGLTRNPDFLRLWAGQTVSAFGSMFGALSLTALVFLGASVAQMGLLAMARGLPALLFALFAGVWVDRLRRRPVMIAADLGRAVLLLTVPAAALADSLYIEQLYAVAFLVGFLELGFDLAYRSYLPSVVERWEILEGNSKLSATESIAESASPAIGGWIVQAASGPVAVLVDALTFLWSAVCIGAIRRPEPKPQPHADSGMLSEMREGLALVRHDRVLRALVAAGGTFRFFGGFFEALYAVFLIRTLDFSPLLMGITIGAGGIGSFAGALVAGVMTRRLGYGPSILVSRVAIDAFALLIPLAGGPKEMAFAMIIVAQLCGDPFWATYEIATTSLRQSITPERALGRVNSSMNVVQSGLQPLGALTAGLLAEAIGVRETIWIAIGGGALGIAWLLASPIPRLREIPEHGGSSP